jgi:hypothetical protein
MRESRGKGMGKLSRKCNFDLAMEFPDTECLAEDRNGTMGVENGKSREKTIKLSEYRNTRYRKAMESWGR